MKKIILKFPFGYLTIILAVITISLLIKFEEESKFYNYFNLLPTITMISYLIFWNLRPFRKYYIDYELDISTKKKILILDLIFNVFVPLILVILMFKMMEKYHKLDWAIGGLIARLFIFFILISLALNWIIKKVFVKIK